MQETQVQSLGWEDPVEEEMATHFSIPAWENPRTGASEATVHGDCQRVGQDLQAKQQTRKGEGSHCLNLFCFFNIYKVSSQAWMRCRKIGKIICKYVAKSSDILYVKLM